MSPHPNSRASMQGTVAPGWEPVADAFARNLTEETGAAFCVLLDGQVVVDLVGGEAAPGRPWTPDTMATLFSATKGLSALAFLALIDSGRLDPEAPVARYWPEFAQAGKEPITVRMLLEHRSGLAWVDPPLDVETLGDPQRLAPVLAAQAPGLRPGTQGYGATAWGKYAGVLYWKVAGETIGAWLRREVHDPLGAEIHLGIGAEGMSHLARLVPPGVPDFLRTVLPLLAFDRGHDGQIYRAGARRRSPTAKAIANPASIGAFRLHRMHELEILRHELPWVGATGSARGLARVYGALARGGELDGVRLVSPAAVARVSARVPLQMDAIVHKKMAWSLGFLREEAGVFSPGDSGFGHPGAGGALGWASPEHRLGMGYVLNRMDPRLRSPRALRLCAAVARVLEGRRA